MENKTRMNKKAQIRKLMDTIHEIDDLINVFVMTSDEENKYKEYRRMLKDKVIELLQ